VLFFVWDSSAYGDWILVQYLVGQSESAAKINCVDILEILGTMVLFSSFCSHTN
jgi:hypothetical protein